VRLDLTNNKIEELLKFEPEVKHSDLALSPDGRWVYYLKCFGDNNIEFWRFSMDEQMNYLISKSFPHYRFLSIHPNGKDILYTLGEGGGKSSLWVMRNFLDK